MGNPSNFMGNHGDQSLETCSDQNFDSNVIKRELVSVLESLGIDVKKYCEKVCDDIIILLSDFDSSRNPMDFLKNSGELLMEYKNKGLNINGNNVAAFISYISNRELNDDQISKLVEFQKWGITVKDFIDIRTLIYSGEVSYDTVKDLRHRFDTPVLRFVEELGLNDEEYNKWCLFAELMGVDFSDCDNLYEKFVSLIKDNFSYDRWCLYEGIELSDSDKLHEKFVSLIKDKSSSNNLLADILKIDSKFLQQLIDLFGTIKFDAFKSLLCVNGSLSDVVFKKLLDLKYQGNLKDGILETIEFVNGQLEIYDSNKILINHDETELKIDTDGERCKDYKKHINSLYDENRTLEMFLNDRNILSIIKANYEKFSLNQSLESGSDQKFNSKTFLDISLFLESINIGPEFSDKVLDDISSALSSNNDSCDPVKFLESKKNLLLEYKKKGLDVDGNNLVAFASFRKLNDDEISKLVEFQKGGITVRNSDNIQVLLNCKDFLLEYIKKGLNVGRNNVVAFASFRKLNDDEISKLVEFQKGGIAVRKLDDIQILLNRKDFLLEYIKKGLNVGRNNVVAFASFRKLNDDEISKLVEFQRWGITVRNSDDIQILISCGEVSYETVEKLINDNGFDVAYPILLLVGELGLNYEEFYKFSLFAELMGVNFKDSDKLDENLTLFANGNFSSEDFMSILDDVLKMDSKFLRQLIDLFGTIKFEALECLLSVKDCLCDDAFNVLFELKHKGKLQEGIMNMIENYSNNLDFYNENKNHILYYENKQKKNNGQDFNYGRELEAKLHSLYDENEALEMYFHDCDILNIIKANYEKFFDN